MSTPNPIHYWSVIKTKTGFLKHDNGTIDNNPPVIKGAARLIQSIVQPTDDECTIAFGLDALSVAKTTQIALIEKDFSNQITSGVDCSSVISGLTLAVDDTARTNWAQLITLWQLADAQQPSNASTLAASSYPIVDLSGTVHLITVAQARNAILLAASTYAGWWGTRASKEQQIVAATTVEAVQAIT